MYIIVLYSVKNKTKLFSDKTFNTSNLSTVSFRSKLASFPVKISATRRRSNP